MQHLKLALLALLSFACVYLACLPAFALDGAAAATPSQSQALGDLVFYYVGIAAAALTTLSTLLPRGWKLTQICARFSADLRGILTPDTSDDPSWMKRPPPGGGSVLLVALLLTVPGCAFFRSSVAPAVVECAPDQQYLIDGLSAILQGENFVQVLERVGADKGPDFVVCALRKFLDRVAVAPDTALEREHAHAYLESH